MSTRTILLPLLMFALPALMIALPPQAGGPQKTENKIRTLPGVQADGAVQLPNTWSIKPAGKQIELGDFPVNIALHPSGKWLAVLHAGYGDHEIILVDLQGKTARVSSRVVLRQTYIGLTFSPDGKFLFASGGEFDHIHMFDFGEGLLSNPRQLPIPPTKTDKFIPGGLAVHPKGTTLYVAGVWGHAVCILPLDRPKKGVIVPVGEGSFPNSCLVDASGKRLYVSLWSKSCVAVIDLDENKVVRTLPTEKHPTEMLFGPGEKTLFVACANSTRVSVVNLADGKALETINCALYAGAPAGNTPNSLSMTPDGQLLFVANADNNNVAVFNVAKPGDTKPLGFIPTGIYPTSVRYNPADKKLYIANGRGSSTRANPQGPRPDLPQNPSIQQYIAGLYRGTLSIVDLPNEETMVTYSKQAYECSLLRADLGVTMKAPKDSPIPAKVGQPSPIKYCIYIIRENRTYDQVFGDIKEGNGDPNLCIFPEKITPNAHRLARQFVLLDNFYCEGEVSADGHEWSMGAYCTDWVKRIWPLSLSRKSNEKASPLPVGRAVRRSGTTGRRLPLGPLRRSQGQLPQLR